MTVGTLGIVGVMTAARVFLLSVSLYTNDIDSGRPIRVR